MKQHVLDRTPTFSIADVARTLALTAEGVRKRRIARWLLALPVASDFSYPAWQFSGPASVGGTALLAGLVEVLAAIDDQSPWVRFDLLTTPMPDESGRSVLDLLRASEKEAAIEAVALHGEHAAL